MKFASPEKIVRRMSLGPTFDLPHGCSPVRRYLKHISGKLFWYEDKYLTQLDFVDFEKAIHRAFQAPEAFIEQTTETLSAPLVTWDCHRID